MDLYLGGLFLGGGWTYQNFTVRFFLHGNVGKLILGVIMTSHEKVSWFTCIMV